MDYNFEIKSVDFTSTRTVTRVDIEITGLKLHESVCVRATLIDSNSEVFNRVNYVLTGTDYTSWGADDNYIRDYVMLQLGLSLPDPAPM
jgi:hypothetical protein